VSWVKAPGDKLVVVLAISVVFETKLSVDFCHLTTFPVLPDNVRALAVLPLQIVCAAATVPPTEAASTVIFTVFEFAEAHTPL
jgi:hypothetical protein